MRKEQCVVRWENHQSALFCKFGTFFLNQKHVDCTLVADGGSIKAHKVVLCACSSYFEKLLQEQCNAQPIFILNDITFEELLAILVYMYFGIVYISPDQLDSFLKAVEKLHINVPSGNIQSNIETLDCIHPLGLNTDFALLRTGSMGENPSSKNSTVYNTQKPLTVESLKWHNKQYCPQANVNGASSLASKQSGSNVHATRIQAAALQQHLQRQQMTTNYAGVEKNTKIVHVAAAGGDRIPNKSECKTLSSENRTENNFNLLSGDHFDNKIFLMLQSGKTHLDK